jgi:hypothetical protein
MENEGRGWPDLHIASGNATFLMKQAFDARRTSPRSTDKEEVA